METFPLFNFHKKTIQTKSHEVSKRRLLIFLLFSNVWFIGTTGRPKGVTITHSALIIQSMAKIAIVGYSEDDVRLSSDEIRLFLHLSRFGIWRVCVIDSVSTLVICRYICIQLHCAISAVCHQPFPRYWLELAMSFYLSSRPNQPLRLYNTTMSLLWSPFLQWWPTWFPLRCRCRISLLRTYFLHVMYYT